MYQQILDKIKEYNRIIIHRHGRPDGDAMGSQIGLKHILKANFPEKEIYVVGDTSGYLSFMEDSAMDEVADELFKDALSIILDCGSSHLIYDDRYQNAADTIRFDHHLFCEEIAHLEVVDSSFESCCGLIADFAMQCGLQVPPLAAQSLYTGMVTDSGRFRYDSTTSRTFAIASYLMEQGIDVNTIYNNLYAEEFESKKLRSQFILKTQFTENRVAYIYTTLDELNALNKDTFSISRGMVNTMADIKGTDIWVNFTETEEGILCELRSNNYNINPIAVKYGGGGHKKASGACVHSKEEAMAMLADLDAMVKENKPE